MPNSKLRSFLNDLTPAELAARLELALEGAGLGVWDWDLTNDGVNFDRRWCEMLGLDHASTTPRPLCSSKPGSLGCIRMTSRSATTTLAAISEVKRLSMKTSTA
ncbi:MAG: hypothetical protein ACLGG7_00650 [Bacteriovoracia bacterium]